MTPENEMNEELKALLGDSYKEGMTLEEVGAFFKGKKFADLSSGNYVDKAKYDNQINSLNAKITEKENALNAKLTDEEKNAKASQEQAQRIKDLEKMLKDNTISGNKNVVNSVLQGSRDILGIQATDNDFVSFVDNITTEDSEKTNKIANYISKIIKDSYEKGKQDATKDAMGNFGQHKGQDSDGNGGKEISDLGKRLATAKKGKQEEYNYFK